MVRDLMDALRSFATNRQGTNVAGREWGMKRNGCSIPVYWDTIAMSRSRE